MVFAPGALRRRIRDFGVFDFDNAVFAPLWERLSAEMSHARATAEFNRHVRYQISDHRPIWVELDLQ